jgi:hypothetical protein
MMHYNTSMAAAMALLGWDEAKYTQHQYEAGLEYLSEVMQLKKNWSRQLEGERMYWNWWKSQWELRTKVWLSMRTAGEARERVERMYRTLHEPKGLDVHPHRLLMRRSYERMYQHLLNEDTSIKK